MRYVSFLLTLVSLLAHQTVFGYTVVLKSGKEVEGIKVAEDSFTLQIKDEQGILLSFRKTTIDLETTEKINRDISVKSQPSQTTFCWGERRPPDPTLVELAEQTKKNRKNSQTLQMKDLHRMPAITIMGAEVSDAVVESSVLNEEQWRREGRSLREDLEVLRQSKISADEACRKARENSMIKLVKPRRGSIIIVDPSEEPTDCERAKKVRQQLQQAQEHYEDFEDRARQAGVPWQWFD